MIRSSSFEFFQHNWETRDWAVRLSVHDITARLLHSRCNKCFFYVSGKWPADIERLNSSVKNDAISSATSFIVKTYTRQIVGRFMFVYFVIAAVDVVSAVFSYIVSSMRDAEQCCSTLASWSVASSTEWLWGNFKRRLSVHVLELLYKSCLLW